MIRALVLAAGEVEHAHILGCSHMAFNHWRGFLETLVFIYVPLLPHRLLQTTVNFLKFKG